MPQSVEKKQEIGERLLRGEDVTITLGSEDGLQTEEGGSGITRLAQDRTRASDEPTGPSTDPQEHTHDHAPVSQQGEPGVPAELVVQVLSNRAGMRETDLAIREARILLLEAEIRELHQIIDHIQGN